MTPILEFHNIVRAFQQGSPVLDDVSFSMQPGEVVGLLGRNGAGKTTLINIAMGMLFPQAGSVRVFGLSPTEDPVAVKKRVGYVSEDQVLPPGSSIAELIALHRYLFPDWDTAMEREILDRFRLSVRANRQAQQGRSTISGAALRGVSSSGPADPGRTGRRTRSRGAP
jgi:ABC-2 type transport system ATP-binding protein